MQWTHIQTLATLRWPGFKDFSFKLVLLWWWGTWGWGERHIRCWLTPSLPDPWPRPGKSKTYASNFVGFQHAEIYIFIAKKGLFFEVEMGWKWSTKVYFQMNIRGHWCEKVNIGALKW